MGQLKLTFISWNAEVIDMFLFVILKSLEYLLLILFFSHNIMKDVMVIGISCGVKAPIQIST